jgi:hypothetical protein
MTVAITNRNGVTGARNQESTVGERTVRPARDRAFCVRERARRSRSDA